MRKLSCLVLVPFTLVAFVFGQTASQCEDQLKALGYDPAKVRAFVTDLKRAVATDNRERLSSMIDYPLTVRVENHPYRIATKSLLLKKYAQIFTPRVKAVLAAQEPGTVCISSNSFMIGHGEIWFDEIATGGFKILIVAPPDAN
jgi:hypothetical protein